MSFGQQDQDDVLRALSGLISGPPSGIADDMDLTDDRGLANDQAEQARVRAIQQNVPYATHFGDDNPPDMDLTRDPDLLREQLDRKLQLSPEHDHVPTPMSRDEFVNDPDAGSAARLMGAGPNERAQNFEAPTQLARGDFVDALKAGPPDPNAAAENRGIAPDEARARLDQQMQLLPEKEAPERSSVGTPPTPDAKATTPPSDDATDERPARMAAPEPDFKLDAGLGRGVSESAPASTGYSPNALRGLTGGRGGGDSGAPEVSPLAVIAAALDRNPGQQLAAVMGVAAQQKQAWQANQQKMAQQDAQNDIKSRLTDAQIRKLDREGHATSDWAADNSAYKWSQYDQRSKEFGAEQSRLELQEKNWRAINDPESPEFKARNEAKEKAGYGTNYAGQQGRTDAKVAGIPDTTNVIDAEARARVGAVDAQRHADAPVANADAADRSAKSAEARLPAQQKLKTMETPEQTRAAADQFSKETAYDRGAASQLDVIDSVTKKYGDDIPGVGLGTGFVPDAVRGMVAENSDDPQQRERQQDALTLSNAKQTLAEMAQRKESGAAGPEAEKLRYMIRVGAQPNATTTQFKTAIDAARNLTRMSLNAFASGKGDAATGVMDSSGLGGWLNKPDGGGGGDSLVVTGKAGPKAAAVVGKGAEQAADAGTAQDYLIVNQRGQSTKRRLTDAQKQALEQRGFELEISP